MPIIQIENVAPDSTGLGMLPLFKDLEDSLFAPRVAAPRIPLFGFPVKPLPAPSPVQDAPLGWMFPRRNGGIVPPWRRFPWMSAPPTPGPILPPVNTGPLPPSPVVVSDAPATGAPSSTPATGAPVSTMTPPVPLVGAPAPVSSATASMFATPSGSVSMFANSGAPTASSMFGTVQGSGSQVAKVSGENALSGVPEGSGRTIGLVLVAGLALLTAWGFHLNKQDASKRRKAAR